MMTTQKNDDPKEKEEGLSSDTHLFPAFLSQRWFFAITLSFAVVLLGGILIGRTMTLRHPPFVQIEALTERLKILEKKNTPQFLPGATLYSSSQRSFMFLRQDVLSGLPFKETLKRFQDTLPPILKERCQGTLKALPSKRVKSFGELVCTFHPTLFVSPFEAKEGFWGGVWRFFRGLLTVQKSGDGTSGQTDSLSRTYGELFNTLEEGRLEEMLDILQESGSSLTPEGHKWLRDAKQFLKVKKILDSLEAELSGKRS